MNDCTMEGISLLRQAEASAIDEELMGSLGFSIDQLMELAGLSVACAIHEVYSPLSYPKVLIVCGPGNNGGDGLVAARHLYHFGYNPTICYPKRTDKPIYRGLVTQLESLAVPFVEAEELPDQLRISYDLVVDAMFGFSFHGNPRPPFDVILQKMNVPSGKTATKAGVPPIVAIDIPSGWHVEHGDVDGTGLRPEMLVSLTAPKLCARSFTGPHHFLGGRFVPPGIATKYNLRLPSYPGSAMCVRLGKAEVDVAALRADYLGQELLEQQCEKDPIEQFHKWFSEALANGVPEPNAMALSTVDENGNPSSRMVLLKGVDNDGFVWYTNYGSRKARELMGTNGSRAALVFWWPGLQRQVRVEGTVEKVSQVESDQYFQSRPRGSQLGAIVSPQSSVIAGRHVLENLYSDLVEQFPEGQKIPRPDNWGGFRLRQTAVEFWQGRTSRLHDRLLYSLQTTEGGDGRKWRIDRLAP